MAGSIVPESTLRLERTEYTRLVWAFVISLILHAAFFGTYQVGKRFGWWQHLRTPAWLQPARMLTEVLRKAAQKERPRELPLMFVEVNPVQEVTEPPKDAPYYSDKNSRAANPEPDKDTSIPRIDGKQEQVAKTEDVPFTPLQPTRPVEPPKTEQPEEKAKPARLPGDLGLGEPEIVPKPDTGQAKTTRPRTLKEALAKNQANRIPGEKMKMDGGVKRHLAMGSVDAKATPFGSYDHQLIEAISQRWFALLDQRDYASDSRGKVVINFKLFSDGSVQGMGISENTTTSEVLGIICRKAIEDPAPFPKWPTDMERMLGNTRHIQFTFYYN